MVEETDARVADPVEPDWVHLAVTHASRLSGVSAAELIPDPAVQATSSGRRVVHLHQHYRGVPVFQAGCMLTFDRDGSLQDLKNATVSVREGFQLIPAVGAEMAAREGARHVLPLSRFKPRILASFPHPYRPTILHPGPFAEPIPAHLVLFPLGARVRLAWCMTLALPDQRGEYDLVVSADPSAGPPGRPEVLYCRSILASVLAQGHVFFPFPGPAASRLQPFPAPLGALPASLRAPVQGFPFDWVDRDSLQGNCTSVFLTNTKKSFRGTAAGGVTTFSPAAPAGNDQKLVNAFYFCNVMHDFFYALGFDEAAGNFQNVNRVHAGLGGDCVIVRIFNTVLNGHATMRGRPDGRSGEMRLGVLPGSLRHTALDPDVVIHEFTHGVTERTVGGPMNFRALESAQSIALAEGWSDYYALTFQSHGLPAEDEKVAFGDWVADRPAGLRGFLYGDGFPKTFGDLGQDRYQNAANCGEVWCAALMRMNREIGRELGDTRRGHQIGWQAVFDGLKLVHPNPGFLQARDAIYLALDDLRSAGLLSTPDHQAAATAARRAFGLLGMGPDARSNGTALTGNAAG
ncbi:MAG: M36 family metallopeptidase [Acidobacteriota bacterium]